MPLHDTDKQTTMSNKEDILSNIRKNIRTTFDMPSFDGMTGTRYPDPEAQFRQTSVTVGSRVVSLKETGKDINQAIRDLFPDAKTVASNLPEVTIADLNPDTVAEAQQLNGTDVGVVRGMLGVAENGCVWVPQTMKEKAVCFISEELVIVLDHTQIVSNMHEAYARIEMPDYGYGCFISGPSKTADIAQALVMGAQAARGVTILLV